MTEVTFNTPQPVNVNIQQGIPFVMSLSALSDDLPSGWSPVNISVFPY